MAIDYSQLAIPKGKTRKQVKARKDREDARKLKAFRDAVWQREHDKMADPFAPSYFAKCQDCRAWVDRRRGASIPGHVHHVMSRREKALRTVPSNGRLLCRRCHNKRHRREF